jgi:hypothetical protein
MDGWMSELRNHFWNVLWNFVLRSWTNPSMFIGLGREGAAGAWRWCCYGFSCLVGKISALVSKPPWAKTQMENGGRTLAQELPESVFNH